ncbi:hypothetical protein V6N13_005437 [Hibiscus sabdariffa]
MVDPSSRAGYVELGEHSSPKLDNSVCLERSEGVNNSRIRHNVPGERRLCCLGLVGFRSLLGFQQGWMKWLSGVIDNALYPVLSLDYLKSTISELEGGLPRTIAVLAITIVLTYMSYRGLNIVGWVAIFLEVFSLLPFIFMGFVAVPRLNASRWLVMDLGNVNWSGTPLVLLLYSSYQPPCTSGSTHNLRVVRVQRLQLLSYRLYAHVMLLRQLTS